MTLTIVRFKRRSKLEILGANTALRFILRFERRERARVRLKAIQRARRVQRRLQP